MTAKELAEMLNGREYGNVMTRDERKTAKESGLVAVYGYSDDCAELDGAIYDEVSCYDGGAFYVNRDGLLNDPDCRNQMCRYYSDALKSAKKIEAVWGADGRENGPAWSYKTDIPHETFNIYEDGELFCVGIVFNVEDL